MKVRVKVIGKGTMEDPFRPALSTPINFHNAEYEGDTVIIRIAKADKDKIANDIIEIIEK